MTIQHPKTTLSGIAVLIIVAAMAVSNIFASVHGQPVDWTKVGTMAIGMAGAAGLIGAADGRP